MDNLARQIKASFSDLHIAGDIPRLVSGKVLGDDACFADGRAEIEGYAFEVPKDAEGALRIFNVESDFAFRHEPATTGLGAFLATDSHRAIGKSHGEDKRGLALCPYQRQFDIAGKACGRTLKYVLPDEIILPGLAAFKDPAIGENFGTDPDLTASRRKGWSDALPPHGADHFIHSLLGLSRSIEEQIGIRVRSQAAEGMTENTHGAAHHCCDVDFVFYVEETVRLWMSLGAPEHFRQSVERGG
jgi:hypothetical protein